MLCAAALAMVAASSLLADGASAATLGSWCAPDPQVFPRDQAGHLRYGEAEGDIGEITAGGGVSETGALPGIVQGVTTGPDGATWFTYTSLTGARSNVGRVAPDGTVTTYPVPALPD